MDMWVWWTIAGVALAVGEMAIMGFFLAPFAGGAFAAAIFSLAGAGTAVSIVVFAVITALLFLFVRPVARRHMLHQPAETRTGTAALIGRSGIVLERIANDEGVGVVKIDGEVWTARAYDEDDVIEAGARVQVIQIRGATALVSE
jgi:membrane protein implicated in regulation of membrane protease activity